MSDAKLPPPDPDVTEDLAEESNDDPAVAGVGPALLVPPLPDAQESATDPDQNERNEDPNG